jgi:MFS transporter, OPA family, glycerol-3-phosphate transporter
MPTTADSPPSFGPSFSVRRYQNFIVLGLLYAFFYMSRYNNAAAMPQIMAFFGWDKTRVGLFEAMMPFVYGLSVMINGPIADRIGGKKAFLFGAVGVVIMNGLMGACTLLVATPAVVEGVGAARHVISPAAYLHGLSDGGMIALMATIWGINGYFQSLGALSIVKVNTLWFHRGERGKFSAIFGILIRLGLIFAFSGVPFIAGSSLPLACVWWIPAALVAVMALLVRKLVENSPEEAGYPEFDTGDGPQEEGGRAPLGEVMRRVFANRKAWVIVICSIMIGFVRRGTIDVWFRTYFSEVFAGETAAYQCAAWGIALFGIGGGFLLGISSDKLFQSRRAPVITIGFIGMAIMLALGGLIHRLQLGPYAAALGLGLLSLFVNGAHGIIGGAASMDLGGKKASATAAGLFDGMQYLVAGPLTGIAMGWLLQNQGWQIWQWALIPFAIVGAIVMSTLWKEKSLKAPAH